ncbi:MAG: ATP phosphoribosyltransferase regulatory subunit [Candidatus Cloacimonetes bacterium]|nr:ATP phosphoribosyltransferase regulatory subunit [Candidatus Cloacimonadota bacterium]
MPVKLKNFHEFMPEDVWKWKSIESKIDQVLALYNYQEIRLSILQDYDVLHKGITALMDDKEAFQAVQQVLNLSSPDNNISLLSLRPEGTISVLHHIAKIFKPQGTHRLYYHGPMFRKDKRQNPMEFYQLGVELLGSDSILSENEIISLGMKICTELGLKETKLELNSYGCQDCRPKFFNEMRKYLSEHQNEFCKSCYNDLMQNPLADTRCVQEHCLHTAFQGPRIQDFLCKKCHADFAKVKKIQANLANDYSVNHYLVKNFAYYNETVFDFVLEYQDKKLVLGGGGRYDHLSGMITGKKIPAVGFYLNLDIIFALMNQRDIFLSKREPFSVYVCSQSSDLEIMMLQISQELQTHNIITILSPSISDTETDIANATSFNCPVMIILRDENILDGKALIRNLSKGYQSYVPLNQIISEILIARKALQQE